MSSLNDSNNSLGSNDSNVSRDPNALTNVSNVSHDSNASISIFILIDALGWEFIKNRPFLNDIATTKMPVKSILGFSSGVIPSILTGKYPQEHKHWSLYYYSPKTSPFGWTKALLWLPDSILNTRLTRKIIEEISKRLMGYTGYFETYLIPIKQLHLFDICEKKNIYAPKGMDKTESIFDILQMNKVDYRSFTYPLKDKEILAKAKESLKNDRSNFYFLYLSEFDALLHSSCGNNTKINQAIDSYEEEIKELYQTAKNRSQEINLYIFSDHGMAQVNNSEDLKSNIEKLGLKVPNDYVAFYDSTMARFWFYNDAAKDTITDLLNFKNYGRILTNEEIGTLGLDFTDNMYGETIFLMNTGTIINPSYMGNKAPQGMHGYDIQDKSMNASLISNQKIEEITDVKDIFKIMYNSISTKMDGPPLQSSGETPRTRCLKVLYFLNSIVRGGVEEHVLGLLKHIDKNKFEPILVCPQPLLDLLKEDLEKLGINTYPVCIRRWRNIGQINKFMRILRAEKPDVVHSHLFFATMFAAPLAKLAGVPMVIETAHLREAWRKGIKKLFFIDRFFYHFVDEVIAVSNAVKKFLVENKKLPEDKIKVIYNGVDLNKFHPNVSNSSNNSNVSNGSHVSNDSHISNGHQPRTTHHAPRTNFTVGVIGRLEPQKGHKYFLEAIKLLNNKYSDVRFVIAGEGSLRQELEQQVNSLGIKNRIEFLGYRKDIVNLLQEIDLLVLPSLYEGLPLVVLEAGAMGKPVIATNVDGSPEVIINKETGLIIPPEDSTALKDALELFLKDRRLPQELGENAIMHIAENFSHKKQIAETESLYLKLMGA